MKIVVANDGTGDFESVQQAINSVKPDTYAEIFIKNGYYFEKVVLDKPNITLTGEDAENTVIVYNDSAYRKDEKGEPLGTMRTATFEITRNAENTVLKELTIQNSAGYGKIVGQAVALASGGDKTTVINCRLIARQDTLMLPPCFKEAAKNPDLYIRQYFENCYIEGDVDFIFGGAAAMFKNCELFCTRRPTGYNCFITAASTPENADFGMVFTDCTVGGNAEPHTVYLGRPWTPGAKTVFINTKASDVLNPAVWSKWGKKAQHPAACYAQNSFTDKTQVADWTYILDDKDISVYTIENIFKGWQPKI